MFIIVILLVIFFVFASSIKILSWQKFIFETQLSFFRKYGLNRHHMLLVGLIEFSASLLLIASLFLGLNTLESIGALGIAVTSVGALYFHLRFDTFKDAIPAISTLTLSIILLAANNSICSLMT